MNIFDFLNVDEVQGVFRHVLTTAGGALVTHGLVSGTDVNTVVGALVAIVGVLLSVAEKRARKNGNGGNDTPQVPPTATAPVTQ